MVNVQQERTETSSYNTILFAIHSTLGLCEICIKALPQCLKLR